MAVYRSQIVIPYDTNLPEDVITNTLHWETDVPHPVEDVADQVEGAIELFYQGVYRPSFGMADYCSPAAAFIKWYALADPPPRVPYITTFTASTANVSSQIPTEVSMVLSFQGPPVSGTPQSRRRGRIYLGGIPNAWMQTSAGPVFPTFLLDQRATVVQEAGAHLMGPHGLVGAEWVVWSPTDQEATVVTNGWVDNTPDTQRRRGVKPTARSIFPV